MKPKIKVYPTTWAIRSRIDGGSYYSTESIVRPSTLYVLHKDEMVIAQDDYTLRIPAELFAEISALAQDLAQNLEMGVRM